MKRFVRCLMLFAALSVGWAANAQSLFDYTFSTGVDSTRWVNLTNYTDLSSGGSGDWWYSSVTNIGFTFPFGENEYTQFSVNSDGNLRLGSVATGTSYYSTPFSSSYASYNAPKINFFGCDGFLVSGTHYVHSQTFGDTMLVVEFCLGPYNSNYRNQQFRWQVQLHASGNIQVVFATTQGTSSSSSHQMGLCVDASEGWVVNSSNQAVSFTNGSYENWDHSLWPSGNYYCFTRPVFTCLPLRDVVVSNIDLYSATVSWSLRDSSQTNFIVSYGLGTDTANYTEVSVTGTSYTIPGLLPASNYNVRVKAVCAADDQSIWTTLTPFTTLLCASTDQCPVIVNLNDSYGDGWNGGYLTLEDSLTGHVLHTFELPYGSSAVDTAYICNLRNCNIVWHPGGFDGEVSFVVFDNLGDTIFAASYPSDGVIHTFYSLCIEPDCWPVENVTVDALDYSANVSWSLHDSTQNTFVVAYGTGANPDYLTQMNVTGTTATITGLDLATTYNVYVKAVCSADEQSTWVGPVAFSTPLCPQSEQCYVYMSLGMNYYSSWHGGNFALVDSTTGTTVHTFQYDYDHTATWDSAQICNGHVYNLVWTPSSSYYYNYYIHAVLFDINGDTLYAPTSFIDTSTFSFISNCTYYSCRRLQNVFVDEVTDTSVNLHWTLIDSSQTNFVVAYGIGSDPDNMPQVAVSGTTATITGLNPGINYDVYVKPVCSTDDHGPWTHAVATTNPCSDADMCYIIVEKASAWSAWGSINLALVDSANGSTFRLISYQYLEDGSVDSILVCPDRTYYLQVTGPNSYWYPYEYSFTIRDYLGLPICNSDFFSADTMLKLRTSCAPPTCWPVRDVTVADYDNHNATITWNLYDSTQTAFVLAYGTGNNPDSLTQINCATTSAMLTGLDSSTTYHVYVKAVCDSNDHSNWSFATTFTTSMCPASDMCRIYVQLNNSIPDDWAGNGMWLVDSVTNEIVCQIDLNELAETVYDSVYVCNGRTYILSFPTDYYGRGVIDSGFASYASMRVTDVAGAEIHTYHFEPYTGIESVIFVADCSIPSCQLVRNVTVSNVEDSTAALSWDLRDTTQTNFVVAYGTGTNPDSLTQALVSTTSYMLSGLTPATHYNVYVKAVCSDLESSRWSPVSSFTTAACASAEMCKIYVTVSQGTDQDWMSFHPLTLTDSLTGAVSHVFNLGEMCTTTLIDSAIVCPGRVYTLFWEGDYGGSGSVITVTDRVGTVIDTAQFSFYSRYDYSASFTSSCDIPSCLPVSDVAVSNVATSSATVTWSLRDSAQTSFVVAYGTSTNPDSLIQATTTTNSYQLSGLTPGIQYYVFVKAVCSGIDHSSWSPAVAFTTPLCPAENQCYVYIDMADSYGDGWNNGFLTMVDTLTGNTVASFSMNQGTNAADSAVVCVDRVYGLQWHSGYYDSEVSFTLRNILGDTIYSAEVPDEDSVLYFTAVCDTTPQPGVSVTVAVNNPTMGTTIPAPGVYNYAVDDTLVVTAVPAPGYHFVEWHVSIDSNSFTDTTTTIHQPIYFFMDGQTISLTAYFDVDPVAGVSLSVNDSTMGTTNPAPGFYEFSEGDTMSVTAVPSDGYHFVNWTISIGFNTFTDSNAVLSQVVSSAMLNQTISVTANFAQDPVATLILAVNDSTMGTTTPAPGTYSYHNGDTVTVTAVPATGYHFLYWSLNYDMFNLTDTHLTLTEVVDANFLGNTVTLTAVFAEDTIVLPETTVILTVNDATMGTTVPAPGTYTFHEGDTMAVTAVPSTGYHFSNWTISNGVITLTETSATLVQVVNAMFLNQTLTVTANFSQDTVVQPVATVNLAVNDSTMGTTVPAPGTYTFHQGDTMSATAVAAPGYHFVNWTISNGMITLTDSNTVLSQVVNALFLNQTISVTANFAQDDPIIDTTTTCNLTVVMTDSYGDGWNGSSWLKFVDTLTNTVVDSVKLMDGSSDTAYVTVIDGHTYNLVWTTGSYDYEDGFVVYDILQTPIYTSDYLVAGTLLTYTAQCVAPSCWPVTNVAVSNITDGTVDVSWSLLDSTQSAFTVAYGTGTNPDSLTQVTATTNSITLTGLNLATTYNVFVKAVCGSDFSDWSDPVSFHTPVCAAADQCYITINMVDSYGDGWNGGYISLVDSATGYSVGTYTITGGASATDSAAVCPGRVYNLLWSAGNYDSEISFSIYDIANTTIYSVSHPSSGLLTSFTATCTIPNCMQVQDVSVSNITDSTADVSWTLYDSTQSNFVVAYGTGTNPDSLTQITTTTTSATLTGLSLTTVYNVFVKAVCSADNQSDWSNATTFMTPICAAEDQCSVTIYMTDSYGDGWNGGTLSLVDSITGSVIGSYTITSGTSAVDSATVCPGRVYSLVWTAGNYDSEVSFAVINTALDTVLSASYPNAGILTSFEASCDEPALPFTLTLATANATMGTTNPAPGTYTYYEGDTITISAVEYNHYDFAYWSLTYGTMTYSDTNATVSMVVLPAMAGLSATVTANFEPETYTVSATPNNSVHGTVTGGGSYQYGDTVTLVATANATSHFVNWSDGALTTTRQFIVVSDTTLVANFAYNPVTLTVANSDSTMGTVLPAPGVYQYNVGDTVTVSATALTGYSFDDWSFTVGSAHNTVTTNPYSFVVPASYAGLTANITANWEVNYYTITALSNDTALGTVIGGGSYAYNTSATLQAVPATHCHFVQWNDGNTNATRTVLVTGDATYTATFAYDSVTIVMAVSDAAMGTVNPTTGSYTYAVGDTLTIEATPNAGYQFMNWTVRANGYTTVTDNPINLVIPAAYAGMSVTYTAQFAYDTITVVLAVDDASMGTVNPAPGTYYFVLGDTLTAEALPTIGYEFVGWSLDGGSASLVDNPLTQFFTASQAGQTITYTAFFQVSQQYNVTLSVVDSLGNANVGGSVSGDGAYYPGTEVTITATPAYGYHFVSWTTAEGQLVTTDTVYTFVMGDRDVAFVATFAQNAGDHTGIDDTEFSNIVIFSHGDRIVVRGAENQTIRVFDVVGRLVAQRSDAAEEESIQLTNTGVYLVKVGNAPARRVVIRR